MTGRSAYLDGWRGLAILGVIIGHMRLLPVLDWDILGVELFFALSGRLMAEILFVQQMPVGLFLWRRFTRVWPALFVFVVAMFVTTRVVADFRARPLLAGHAVTALTFTSSYSRAVFGYDNPIIGHIWSLCVEEHTYLLLVLITIVSGKLRRRDMLVALIALLSIADGLFRHFVLGQNLYDAYFLTDSKICSIIVPLLCYLHRGRLERQFGAACGWISLGVGALGIAAFYHRVPDAAREALAPALFGLSIALIDRAPSVVRQFLELRALVLAGLFSYSLYLWQEPLYIVALERDWPFALRLACLAPTLLLALASFYVIERPSRRRLNALLPLRSRSKASRHALDRATSTGI